ncbi:MAG: hypothetical protein U9O24_02790 [Campylobacterota bacterium]|nr:hypothetical protein [Campylobacterota bacterium]
MSFMIVWIYADLTVDEIEKMISTIHLKRVGVQLSKLETTKEPFVRLEEENNVTRFVTPTKTVKLKLHGIVNGKAYINNSWYDVNASVMGYELKHIGKNGVVLRNGNNIKKLFLKKKRDTLIILEER